MQNVIQTMKESIQMEMKTLKQQLMSSHNNKTLSEKSSINGIEDKMQAMSAEKWPSSSIKLLKKKKKDDHLLLR